MNPTQSSHVVFGSGGNDIPILTRASSQSTAGYQTMGLPGGNTPFPGGGANKTVMGPMRMGDADGNAPASAIYPNDLFYPPGQPAPINPPRMFENVGNNVFQPQNNDKALHELLRRLGDQKFKADIKAPFEDYLAQERLARDLDDAARNASLSDLGTSREIIRSMAEQRRQQNEDDYLRRMLDAGMTPEAARKEIEDVRNANALQEAKRVEDRPYQAKMLISRLAASRGVTSMVREPLTQSAAIDTPDRSQAMAQAMGVEGGFGTAPLDANRQFLTPDFYRKFLRRSTTTQEGADEASAFSQLMSQGKLPDAPAGSYSLATLKGQERQNQVELYADGLAARLDSIRARQNRIQKPLPPNVFAKEILDELYAEKGRKPGAETLFSLETIADMDALHLLITLNLLTLSQRGGYGRLRTVLNPLSFGTPDAPAPNVLNDLRTALTTMNSGELNVEIPFASTRKTVTMKRLVEVMNQAKNDNSLRAIADSAGTAYSNALDAWAELTDTNQRRIAQRAAERGPPASERIYREQLLEAQRMREEQKRKTIRTKLGVLGSLRPPPPTFGPNPKPELTPLERRLAMLQGLLPATASTPALAPGVPNAGGGGGGAPELPSRTALGKMNAGEVEALMGQLGYPDQGGKKKNQDYINARR